LAKKSEEDQSSLSKKVEEEALEGVSAFQELRGGGVATHMSMIFALLFHQFFFGKIQTNPQFLHS